MICDYGNCQEDRSLPFTVTERSVTLGQRKRFCSLDHLLLWAIKEKVGLAAWQYKAQIVNNIEQTILSMFEWAKK